MLTRVLAGQVAVTPGGTKDDLHHIVRRELEEGKSGIAYLRDRDFDSEPPPSGTDGVEVDRLINGVVLGYRWDRTELENYLLEPPLVAAALGFDLAEFSAEVARVASVLHAYTAGRWTLGQLRARTRRMTRVRTRPESLSGTAFPLPKSLAEADVVSWLDTVVTRVSQAVAKEFDVAAIRSQFEMYKNVLSGKCGAEILRWYSGKDLLGVLAGYFQSKGINNSAEALERVVVWLETPDGISTAMGHLPDWRNLAGVLSK
ncbi:MAG: hypothetical protein ACLQVX_05115 [Limisphaerales bacterium]